MGKLVAWFGLGRASAQRAETRRIAAAYQHWLEVEHPALWRAHGEALGRLLAEATPATLADRIAAADRLVARHAAA